jgi:hypothetical protein
VSTVDSTITAAQPGSHGRRGSDYTQLWTRVRGVDLALSGLNCQMQTSPVGSYHQAVHHLHAAAEQPVHP